MIVLIKINTSSTEYRYFAIPFGIGFHLLNPDVIEERFGLKVALNAMDEKMMKSIDKKNMSNVPKHAREQISINSEVESFGIDIEQDLILGVTGNSKESDFGKIITGKDSLCISVNNNIKDVEAILKKIYDYYLKDEYKTNFGWIDYIKECKDKSTISLLDNTLIKNIRSKTIETIWMAVPEIIEWADVDGFKYPKCKDYLFEDITLHNLYDTINEEELKSIDINFLKKRQIECIPTTGTLAIKKWKYYDCIYAEIQHSGVLYMLTNGKYYSVENNFKDSVNQDYQNYLGKTPPVITSYSIHYTKLYEVS